MLGLVVAGRVWGGDRPSITLRTDDTAVTVEVIEGRPAITSLKDSSGAEWAGKAPRLIPLVDKAQVNGKEMALQWHFVGQAADRLRFACDEPALELESIWIAHAGPGPIEHQIVITSKAKEPVVLPTQPSIVLALQAPVGHALEQWWVDKGAGTPTKDGTHRRALKAGEESLLRCWPSGRDDPRDPIPWTSVQDVEGKRGWYAGVEMTCRIHFRLQPAAEGVLTAEIGLPADDKVPFQTRIAAGEKLELPMVFVGCYQGEVDDGANRLRSWVRANLIPAVHDERYPLLVNNSWGSGMAVDERLARKMIEESAELGLELFHIDAGWFKTVGDWTANPKKFPKGLGPVADYAHEKGLKFGLWVAWTQGGDQVDPTGKHQVMSVFDPAMADWFAQARFDKNWKANEFTGAAACLGDPQVVEWCLKTLRPLIKEAKLDLLEHDQIMVIDGCAHETHRHTTARADAGYRAAQGYYQVYDTLRAENPNLLFENCVNGGRMVDYGAVRRCHYISITDTYDPLSNRRAFYDSSYALPPEMCECYIENVAVRSLAHFKYMIRSGMMGWCTIMTDTSKWTPEQHEAAKKQFALYKSRLRPLIQGANLYHVSDRPDGVRWDGIEYCDPTSGKGVLFAFRGKTDEAEHAFVLKGLDPAAKYALTFEDGSSQSVKITGQELMAGGVKLKLPEKESSEIVHLVRE